MTFAGLRPLARTARDPLVAAFLVTLAISLIRAPQQPSITLNVGTAGASVDPSDVALVLLGVYLVVRLVRRRDLQRHTWAVLATAALFAAWILASAATNGTTAFVAGGKFVELGILALAAAYLLDSSDRLWVTLVVLVAMNAAADVDAVRGFVETGERQRSFLGSHDLAALGTMTIAVWFVHLCARRGPHRRLAVAAGVMGAIGILLGAALASLIGVYLAALAIVVVARRRGEFRLRSVVVIGATLLVLTGGVLELRSDNLSFLRVWFGVKKGNQPLGAAHGSWSQRIIFAYIGGRVFLANPAFGTGWYPELPPKEFARFLPDARRRYPLQPANLFPPKNGLFIPQMAYDQVLYELGVAGALVFLLLLGATVHASVSGTRRPRDDLDPLLAYGPAAWTASMIGALAGIGLFGGATISTLFWLTLGVAGAFSLGGVRQARADSSTVSSRL